MRPKKEDAHKKLKLFLFIPEICAKGLLLTCQAVKNGQILRKRRKKFQGNKTLVELRRVSCRTIIKALLPSLISDVVFLLSV